MSFPAYGDPIYVKTGGGVRTFTIMRVMWVGEPHAQFYLMEPFTPVLFIVDKYVTWAPVDNSEATEAFLAEVALSL